jgi:hypothetical protein
MPEGPSCYQGRCQNPILACYTRVVKLDPKIRDAFRALGRIGGKKGGPKGGASRMAKLTPEERRALAKKAARARWKKKRELK